MTRTQLDNDHEVVRFLERLRAHAIRKRELYDGVARAVAEKDSPDVWLRHLVEEVGEVASAMTRQRWELVKAECIDVAHCAMLLYFVAALEVESGREG